MPVQTRPSVYHLNHLLWKAIDMVYPPNCGGCDRSGLRWCQTCREQSMKIEKGYCPVCGIPQTGFVICKNCKDFPKEFTAMYSVFMFVGPIRHAVHKLKYRQDMGLGEVFAGEMITAYQKLGWNADLVVPVPLGRKRYSERGYNQASFLARPFAWGNRIQYSEKLVSRVKETHTQVGLNKHERMENVKDAFQSNGKLHGKNILLVDDVATTGSTLSACAAALKLAGANQVWALTLARAPLPVSDNALQSV
ncbi:MAG: ComF family protein [Anaerolineaceae bacterium]|nr:ComF family protein [Anaerolineaceae bacterium]